MNEWIKYSDSPPPDCKTVLMYCHITKSMTCGYLVYGTDGKPINFTIVDFYDSDQWISPEDISHWMFLPNGPE